MFKLDFIDSDMFLMTNLVISLSGSAEMLRAQIRGKPSSFKHFVGNIASAVDCSSKK